LPKFQKVEITEINGKYYLRNYSFIRHLLNEYRPIIQNKSDSVYYQRIHRFCREKLINTDHSKDLMITVEHKELGDITELYAKALDEQSKAISKIIKLSEYGYIFNGILQHSDHSFTRRFWEEYSSGQINYVFVKHAHLVEHINSLLERHYRLLNALTFPKLGPL